MTETNDIPKYTWVLCPKCLGKKHVSSYPCPECNAVGVLVTEETSRPKFTFVPHAGTSLPFPIKPK